MARARSPDSSNPFVFAFPLPTFLYSKYLTDTPTFGSHRHKGYFAPNANRPNLVVLLNAHATKLTLSGTAEPYVVSGVQFTVGDKSYEVKANKEVILSAGAYGTPQLLELSGTFFLLCSISRHPLCLLCMCALPFLRRKQGLDALCDKSH
jgi:hypothetical protein